MKKTLQFVIGILVLIAGVLAVSYLQYRFDRSDVRHAVQAVQTARPLGIEDQTVLEKIVAKYQVKDPQTIVWDSTIESKTQGVVVVSAQVPVLALDDVQPVTAKSHRLLWQVDLVRFSVTPRNGAAKELGELVK